MKERVLFVLTCLLLWTGLATAQTRRVTGVVISGDDGEPVIGASVLVKGTQMGTITNIEGEFTIPNVPATAKTLLVSYVGLKTAEVAISSERMTISLQSDDKVLDEVVITAMGISREKKSLGYAVQEVKADELTQAGSPSVTSSLSGKVAGVQVNQFGGTVGASSRIAIRGNGSLANDQQPLIVVDGVPIANDTQRTGDNYYRGVDYGSGLNDINPEDIESISVLKGGSAALYGMRAGNGVILITTKSGKRSNGVTVSYDMNLTFDHVTNIAKLQNSYGQGHDGDEWHFRNSTYTDYQKYSEEVGFNRGYDESWGPRLDVGLKLVQFDSNGQPADFVSRPNNVRDFFQTGVTMNHMVSIQANSEKTSTRASLSYRDQKGTVPNTDQKKYTGQFNTTMKLNNYVSFDMSANYTRTKSANLNAQGYRANNPINSLVAWSARQMNMQSLKENWDQKDEAGNYTYYNWIDVYHINPYFNVNMNTNSMQRDRIFGKSSLYYQPFEWLKFEGRIGVDYYDIKTFERTYYHPDDPEGAFAQRNTKNTEFNGDFIASANKTFGDFNLTAILGANYRDVCWEFEEMGANALLIPGAYTMGNKVGDAIANLDHSHIRSNSVYGNFSLGWKNQLYLDASARNDWSSTIHDDFFYPSISLSWIPTTSFENIKSSVLEFLKLRAGWAQVGSATDAYRNSSYYYPNTEKGSFNSVGQMYKSFSLPNYNLKPEKVTTWEIGTEIGLFHDRLHLDMTYYQKKTIDQILNVTTSNVVGFGSMLINAGRIDNKGVEIQLRADILQSKKGLNWTSTLNFAKDESMVKYLYLKDGVEQLPGGYGIGWTWSIDTKAIPGEKWGDIVGDAYVRITEDDVANGYATKDQIGAIKLYDNGFPYSQAAHKIGNVTPDFLMGWRNEFSIKNISFGFMLDFRKGGDIWSQTMSHSYSAGVGAPTAADGIRERDVVAGIDMMKNERFVVPASYDKNKVPTSWKKNDVKTDAYTWFNKCGLAETYVFDGSFLKLREAYISWNVPMSLLRKAKYFNRATISLIGTNLALLWVDKSNTLRLDPETGGVSSDSRGLGFEQASTPNSRSFGLKLGLTF
ncbi:SusC/RagA family TonB-linked outer membrane protein [Phocaeicola oris]|uniref:SusC/RagA family TonB-linked outer membrane protein n=1 Tax=Phocaeicola oris TaxID=2896850 RepID=UPI00234E4C51|nr:SusC/RagA family TonB-linked outer membrane protein [Phocaeicola oris]MCE2617019.1 SusC/RagA family TonB-linked outer membrane protein [Phocaeicola oris]